MAEIASHSGHSSVTEGDGWKRLDEEGMPGRHKSKMVRKSWKRASITIRQKHVNTPTTLHIEKESHDE